ncbi:MAG: hypothetical protein LBR70_00795 [Lactobacillaceae bacterium]|jgi:hypothetical protein|nr:hypothetical protein [Lactobacillaceae bacterium]
MDILEKMLLECAKVGYYPTKNVEKIARAKNLMFGREEWYRCPCDGNNSKRRCISELCKNDIETKGICHCNCYAKDK